MSTGELPKAIEIVRQHEAEVLIESDWVCMAGKWFYPEKPLEGIDTRAAQVGKIQAIEAAAKALHEKYRKFRPVPQVPWEQLAPIVREAAIEDAALMIDAYEKAKKE